MQTRDNRVQKPANYALEGYQRGWPTNVDATRGTHGARLHLPHSATRDPLEAKRSTSEWQCAELVRWRR